jgi:hypothetical protein
MWASLTAFAHFSVSARELSLAAWCAWIWNAAFRDSLIAHLRIIQHPSRDPDILRFCGFRACDRVRYLPLLGPHPGSIFY